jgi:hypothetical protein
LPSRWSSYLLCNHGDSLEKQYRKIINKKIYSLNLGNIISLLFSVDVKLPFSAEALLQGMITCIGFLLVIIWVFPMFLVPIIPLFMLFLLFFVCFRAGIRRYADLDLCGVDIRKMTNGMGGWKEANWGWVTTYKYYDGDGRGFTM